jgi:hypothetical protein
MKNKDFEEENYEEAEAFLLLVFTIAIIVILIFLSDLNAINWIINKIKNK